MVFVENKAQCWALFTSKPGMRQFKPWESVKYNIKPVLETQICGKLDATYNPKAQAVNKAQRQLRPEMYYLECFKSRALDHEY